MARIDFRPLWTVQVQHAFFGGACDAIEFIVPPSTQRALAGAHAIARQRDGRLHILYEANEGAQPLSPLAGRTFLFGLKPREPSFELITVPLGLPPGDAALWRNAPDADALTGPAAVRMSGEQLRIEPRSALRPLTLRLFDATDTQRAQAVLDIGNEAWTPPGLFTRGIWRIEEDDGNTLPQSWRLQVEPELIGAWGLLELTVDAGHVAAGHAFALAFAARSDTLRYYVVANRFGEAEFDQVQVLDNGFAAESRPAIQFNRVLPAAFGAGHLAPGLLDPSGGARIALFEAQASVARRARGPSGLELHRNGDLLIGNLPQPGADRPDAQFVVHLSQS
ncbi:hypothetical protein [Variovorax sp. 770b2]|uniref:hypothetical protein n=1 Tax=Variovorax sp. 770b2 TaxID=1566271 RepID=UPI0008ECCBB4|nr:hypothetical protein [Variovorax sp. 770b2]SFP20208.1 hypothetical protein SAMN03159339_0909 [Variovorax sp. 770b2]